MKRLLRIAVACLLLGLIIWKIGGVEKILEPISRVSVPYLLAIFLLHNIDRVLMSYKWSRLLRIQNVRVPLLEIVKVYCSSMIWGMFLPSTIGADAIRIFVIARRGHNRSSLVASVIVERLAGFLSALLLGLVSCLIIYNLTNLGPEVEAVFWSASLALVLAMAAFAASLSGRCYALIDEWLLSRFLSARLAGKIRQFHSSYQSYGSRKGELSLFFLLTFIEQLIPIVISWAIARALGIHVSLLVIAGSFPLALLVARLPISLNGLGLFEGVFTFLMSLGGVPVAEALVIALSARVFQVLSWLPWWVADVIGTGSLRPPLKSIEELPSPAGLN
jgi:glycosyltransferase 2 family protein